MCKLVFLLSAALAAAGALCGCNAAAALPARTNSAAAVRSMDNFGGVLGKRPQLVRPAAGGSDRSMDNFGGVL